MTESMTTIRDGEETILASDLWGTVKNLTPMSPEDELDAWRTTVRTLSALCMMADALVLDPLILAIGDAYNRAQEEELRARVRTERPAGELTEYEQDTLRVLLDRCNALGGAYRALANHLPKYAAQQRDLEILDELRKDANEAFRRYKLECGLSSPL